MAFSIFTSSSPDLFDAEPVVETQWGIMWSLSEPGLLDPPDRADEAERQIVEAALRVYVSNHQPSRAALSSDLGLEWAKTVALFPDDMTLAQRCMDYAVGSSLETEAIAVNMKGSEVAAIRDLLIATTQLATTTPLLIEVVRRNKNVGFCAEARRHIGEALSQSRSVALDSSTTDGVVLDADRCRYAGRGGTASVGSGPGHVRRGREVGRGSRTTPRAGAFRCRGDVALGAAALHVARAAVLSTRSEFRRRSPDSEPRLWTARPAARR